MNKEDRRIIEFFVRLVAVQDFSTLAASQRVHLQEEAERLSPLTDVQALYTAGRKFFSSLERGGKAIVPFSLVLERMDGTITLGWTNTSPGLSLLSRLVSILIRTRKFPFRFCPVCTTLFAPRGRQLTCSLRCTRKKEKGKRKAEISAYMRGYMKRRRTRERERAAATQRALAHEKKSQQAEAKRHASLPPSPWKTDEERKAYQEAERQRLRKIYEKRQHTTAPQGRKEQ